MVAFQMLMALCISISPTLFALNVLVAITCLIGAPRIWARWLCLVFTWLNTLLVLSVLASLIYVSIERVFHGYREELYYIYDALVFPILPMVMVLGMIGLLVVYIWCFRARTKSV